MGYLYPQHILEWHKHEAEVFDFFYTPDKGFWNLVFEPHLTIPKNVRYVFDGNMTGNQIDVENINMKHTINILE